MEHPVIHFQRPLVFSLAVHVLIFGTALAFAHFGELLFGGAPGVMTVALVGAGGRVPSGAAPAPRTEQDVRKETVTESVSAPQVPVMPALNADKEAAAPGPGIADVADGGSGASIAPSIDGSPGTVAGGGSGVSADTAGSLSAEQWQMLQSAIEKAKNYPRLARERGIEGVVLVRFRVLPSGAVDEVSIVKSSGAAVLDEASVRTVHRAGPMPYVDGWIEVPMVYQLQ